MGRDQARRVRMVAMLGAILLLAACETRSISNSGYEAAGGGGRGSPFYQGELTEFDVLGIDVGKPASDKEIAQQLDKRQKLGLRRGAGLMLIQSGAIIPDAPMVKALDRHFSVMPFTGVPLVSRERPASYAASGTTPPRDTDERITNYARALRLAAAKSGAEVILCYWGMLDSAVEHEPTKVVSWIPIVGSVVPDQAQLMRIRLKLALIDVRTGQWSMFVPEAFTDSTLSAALNRAGSDRRQVELLKEQAYKAAADAFVARYAG